MELRELVGDRRRKEVGPGRGDLPELHEHPARALENEPHASGEVGRGERGRRPVAHVEQVLATRVADQLAEAAQRREDAAHGAGRVPPPATGSPAPRPPASDEVEHDRDRQRRQHAEERHDRDDDRGAVGVGVERPGGCRHTHQPADRSGHHAPPPPDPDAEHAATHQADRGDPEWQQQHLGAACAGRWCVARRSAWQSRSRGARRRRLPPHSGRWSWTTIGA
jgi:hypothetical protein